MAKLTSQAKAARTRRLVKRASAIDPGSLADWVRWYDTAQSAARSMADAYDVSLEVAASVIAHVSPMTQWAQNLASAAAILDATRAGKERMPRSFGFKAQRAKAWRVARGESCPWADHGPKTRAFMRCILGDRRAVCVDSWAVRAATGDMSAKSPSPAQYDSFVASYTAAADILGMNPADLQAAVWCDIRGAAD